MKEIKFRIWLGGRFHYWGFMKGKGDYYFAGLPSDNTESVTIQELLERSQQLIGLKDINNKEIFDGDILRCILDVPLHKQDQRIGRVEYDDTWGVWMVSFDNYGESYSFIEIAERFGPSECEIIGNIYENPELLTE